MPNNTSQEDKEKLNELRVTLPKLMNGYLSTQEIRLGYKTLISYAYDFRLFLRFLKENNPSLTAYPTAKLPNEVFENIKLEDVEEFISFMKLTCKKNSSVYRRISSLSAFYKYLVKREIVEKNPFELIERERKKDKEIIRLENDETLKLKYSIKTGYGFTDKQVERNHHSKRDLAIFTILVNEGLRVSELINLNIEDIDLKNYCIGIIRKGGSFEKIYLSDESITALSEYLEERNTYLTEETKDEKAVFLSQVHKRMSVRNVEILLKKYMSVSNPMKTDIIHPHSLRSTFATDYYQATKDVLTLKEKMGHKSIETTMIYTDINKEKLESSRNAVTKLRNKDTSDNE